MSSFLSVPTRNIELFITYYNFVTYTTDDSYYIAYGTTFPDLRAIWTTFRKINLIQIDYNFSELRYDNTPAGEYPRRILSSFLAQVKNFRLDGVQLRNEVTNDLIKRDLTMKDSSTNFGYGLICDNFDIPQTIDNISIDDIPPTNNTPIELIMNMIIRYNFNF